MKDLALGTDNDIAIDDSGEVSLVSDASAVRQRLLMRLSVFKGTWFLDPTFGVDYYASVLGARREDAVLNAVFVPAILETPGVAALKEPIAYEYDGTKRTLTISFTAVTDSDEELEMMMGF
jgi:hypothetical protein